MTDQQIARINELYKKQKSVGLSAEEKIEQAELRSAYLASIRANITSQLDTLKIKNPDGSIIDVKQRHDERMKNNNDNV